MHPKLFRHLPHPEKRAGKGVRRDCERKVEVRNGGEIKIQ